MISPLLDLLFIRALRDWAAEESNPTSGWLGKILPTRLTSRGRRQREAATRAVRSVEVRMLDGMTETEQSGAFRILQSMIRSQRAR